MAFLDFFGQGPTEGSTFQRRVPSNPFQINISGGGSLGTSSGGVDLNLPTRFNDERARIRDVFGGLRGQIDQNQEQAAFGLDFARGRLEDDNGLQTRLGTNLDTLQASTDLATGRLQDDDGTLAALQGLFQSGVTELERFAGNRNPFIESLVNPVTRAAADNVAAVETGFGRRGLSGSSFATQAIADESTRGAQDIQDARARGEVTFQEMDQILRRNALDAASTEQDVFSSRFGDVEAGVGQILDGLRLSQDVDTVRLNNFQAATDQVLQRIEANSQLLGAEADLNEADLRQEMAGLGLGLTAQNILLGDIEGGSTSQGSRDISGLVNTAGQLLGEGGGILGGLGDILGGGDGGGLFDSFGDLFGGGSDAINLGSSLLSGSGGSAASASLIGTDIGSELLFGSSGLGTGTEGLGLFGDIGFGDLGLGGAQSSASAASGAASAGGTGLGSGSFMSNFNPVSAFSSGGLGAGLVAAAPLAIAGLGIASFAGKASARAEEDQFYQERRSEIQSSAPVGPTGGRLVESPNHGVIELAPELGYGRNLQTRDGRQYVTSDGEHIYLLETDELLTLDEWRGRVNASREQLRASQDFLGGDEAELDRGGR